ncbi:MAG: DUF456 domain-containing protein [Bacteroidota bacterium]|nr:DUF456 domain-containing protein [Bacteroidota bacterium]
MEFLIIIFVILLLLIGIIGCIIPVLPGPPISFLGIMVFHFFTSYKMDSDTLWLLAGIVSIITFFDYWLQVYGVRKFGGGKKAINGTILGLVLGLLFFPPFGVIIGPFFGAFLGAKMEAKEDTSRAIKIALGALVGFFGGMILKFTVSIGISILFINQFFPIL